MSGDPKEDPVSQLPRAGVSSREGEEPLMAAQATAGIGEPQDCLAMVVTDADAGWEDIGSAVWICNRMVREGECHPVNGRI
jgi:hypothetical protein